MNLQPLYDLKERLHYAAIAGAGLLGEDFRLQRAAEGLKPLASASPVFSKIDGMLSALLQAPPQERSGILLDLLALTDAVIYTQAQTGPAGPLEPLSAGGGTYLQIAYSQLQPLLTALTATGGGRMELIRSSWETHPEYFSDFRVLPALAAGLGDSYGDIAQLNALILQKQPAALPLLKQGFDPAGKKEMARRVEVISALEGPAATPWLREILPLSKKEVRPAVILALGCDQENAGLLLDLAKAERSGNRDAALQALARLEGDAVQDFWAAEIAKKPENAEHLKDSGTKWAADLAAAAFQTILKRFLGMERQNTPLSESDWSALIRCRAAVLGKSSPAMLDCWRWVDSQLSAFSKLKRGPNVKHVDLGIQLPFWLLNSLCHSGPGPLCAFCMELWQQDEDSPRYLPHALISALLTWPADEVYNRFSPYILTKKPLLDATRKKALHDALLEAFREISWDEDQQRYQLATGQALPNGLDARWYDQLTQTSNTEEILRRLICRKDPQSCAKISVYLFRLIQDGNAPVIQEDITFLRQCGWTDWKGFLNKRVKQKGDLTVYSVVRLLNETSLTNLEKAAELRMLDKIVQEQNAATKRPKWPVLAVQNQLASWEAEQNSSDPPTNPV